MYVLNSRGFRTPEYDIAKKDGTYRIVTIGDSFTFSSGIFVPSVLLWTSQLERKLVDVRQKIFFNEVRQVELINLGYPAVGPSFELRLFELEGLQLSPDTVIQMICLRNDVQDEVPMKAPEVKPGLNSWVKRNLFIVRFLVNTYNIFDYTAMKAYLEKMYENPIGSGPSKAYGKALSVEPCCGKSLTGAEPYDRTKRLFSAARHERKITTDVDHYAVPEPKHLHEAFRRVERVLATMSTYSKANDFRYIVVLAPDERQIYPELQQMVRTSRPKLKFDFDQPTRRLKSILKRLNIEYVDLLPQFKEKRELRMYTIGDTHWNDLGNELAAGVIFRHLVTKSLIP
jgi:hypothetical protein